MMEINLGLYLSVSPSNFIEVLVTVKKFYANNCSHQNLACFCHVIACFEEAIVALFLSVYLCKLGKFPQLSSCQGD
uniref:Uncharacterized protein n=1 Tax=Podarcis muralis TaxID=64176 RepID=A0A670INC2_PODMU